MLRIYLMSVLFFTGCGSAYLGTDDLSDAGWAGKAATGGASEFSSDDMAQPTGGENREFIAHLVVKPSALAGFPEQSLADVKLSNYTPEPSTYKKTLQLYGSCEFSAISSIENQSSLSDQNSDKNATWGDISVSLIAKESHNFLEAHKNILSAKCDRNGHFSVELLADKPYRLTMNPTGAKGLPPSYHHVQLENEASLVYDLSKPTQVLKGKLNLPEQIKIDEFEQPKFSVIILQNSRLVSNKAIVGPREEFSLWLSNPLPYNISKHPIILEIHPVDAQSPYPYIREEINPNEQNISPLIARAYDSLRSLVSWDLQLKAESGSDLEPQITQVYLRHNDLPNIEKLFLTDAAGQLSLELPGGNYSLLVLPDPTSGLTPFAGAFSLDAKASQSDETLLISLAEAKPTDISVTDAEGNPMVSAQIEATLIKAKDENFKALLGSNPPKNQFTTDLAGKMCRLNGFQAPKTCQKLFLVPGTYDFIVKPAPGSDLYFLHKQVEVGGSPISIQFEKAFAFKGKLAAQRNKPISDAFVQIYDRNREPGAHSFRQLAEAFTDKDGNFEVYLPLQKIPSE